MGQPRAAVSDPRRAAGAADRLALRRNRSLYSRIHHRLASGALTADDTTEYLACASSGPAARREVFAGDAIVLLHEATLGALRDIDRSPPPPSARPHAKKRKLVERDAIDRALQTEPATLAA